MKVFLGSSSESLDHIQSEIDITGKVVGFVVDGGTPFLDSEYGDLKRIKEDVLFFANNKCNIILISILDEDFLLKLSEIDILHIAGGSVSFLSKILQMSGVIESIRDMVIKGDLIYSGISAGAMIASKNINIYTKHNNNAYEINCDKGIGIGLVDFLIIPHAQSEEHIKSWYKSFQDIHRGNTNLITMRDGQAISYNGETNKFYF